MKILLDNTVLSNFSSIRRPDLVKLALDDAAAMVEEVYAELQAGVKIGKLPDCDWSWLPVLQLSKSERTMYKRLQKRLDAGEAACLAKASIQGYRVFTDDRNARKIARQMGIPISGTFGLLVRLVDQGVLSLTDADALLNQMIAAGYRSPLTSLATLL